MNDSLTVEVRDGKTYVVTAPLPEHIVISPELWNEAEIYDPDVDGDTGLEPPALWREEIQHADPAQDNDGYMLHVDAENVSCTYRVSGVPDDGPIHATLASWSEK